MGLEIDGELLLPTFVIDSLFRMGSVDAAPRRVAFDDDDDVAEGVASTTTLVMSTPFSGLAASGTAASSSSRGPGTTTGMGKGDGIRSTRTKGTFCLPFDRFPGPFFFGSRTFLDEPDEGIVKE